MDTWSQQLEQLAAFRQQYGHCDVPTGWKDNPRLAKWVSRQRSNEAHLSPERRLQLEELGFHWKSDMQQQQQEQWEARCQALRTFVQQHGHARVPSGQPDYRSLRSWVDRQRRDWDLLSPTQQQQLLSAGFPPKATLQAQADQAWQKMFVRLERYVQLFGDARVPKGWSVDPRLAGWVARQRTYPERLSPEQKQRLDQLGFVWRKDLRKAKERQWQTRYQELVAFHAQHGHCRVPDQYAENPSLGKWVSWQRQRQASLTKERRRQLDALGFVFTIEREKENRLRWFRMYGKLKAFHRTQGHSRVPENWAEDPSLAIWVSVQRQEGKQLPDWKRKKLEALDFAWSEQLKEERRANWESRYEELLAFHQQHGHCRVTLKNAPSRTFFHWVTKQRRFPGRMTAEQRFRLNELGFQWPETSKQAKRQAWDLAFEQLKAFYRRTGHCRVPEGWAEDPKLAHWVAFQRRQENRLPADRKKRLDALGFEWQADLQQQKEREWMEVYERLVDFHRRFGHCQVPYNWTEDTHLGHWVNRQRRQKERMPEARRQLLEALGFEWQVTRGPRPVNIVQ